MATAAAEAERRDAGSDIDSSSPIAAIALTLRQRKDSKYTYAADQVKVKASDRMQVIKMKATQEALPIAAPEAVSDTPDDQAAPVVEKKA